MRRADLEADWTGIRAQLRMVGKPDSRFDMDLDRFIPAFEGVTQATDQLLALPAYSSAQSLFVTPDNSIQHLRWQALAAGKRLLAPSYGLHRGFVLIDPASFNPGEAMFASWGDGMQWFGKPVAIEDLGGVVGRIDAIVAGAAAVTRDGLRFGMGHRYLDLEWHLLLVSGCIEPWTPVWSIVHDCQMLDRDEPGDVDNVRATRIFTPSRELECKIRAQPESVRDTILGELFGDTAIPPALRHAFGQRP